MSVADVQSLVALISNGQYDPTLFQGFFNSEMTRIGGADWLEFAAKSNGVWR